MSIIEEIIKNKEEYLKDFSPKEIDEKFYLIDFCDKKIKIKKNDIFAIYAINYFFDYFNCLDEEKDIEIEKFIDFYKNDKKGEINILDKIEELEMDKEEKKELIRDYFLTLQKGKSALLFLIDADLYDIFFP